MSGNHEQAVSVEQFVGEMMKRYKADIEDVILYGYNAGWLEEQELMGRGHLLERRSAARILHQFMLLELKETDAAEVSVATRLKDLYECRSCVGHVMQVYAKGIMDSYTDDAGCFIFGMREQVSVDECCDIIERLFNVKKRISETIEITAEIEVITAEKALQSIEKDKNALLIDVRTVSEYAENHMDGAVNIPLADILKNPYMVSERRDIRILLYCSEGYQSEIAARCLMEAGYEKVCCFAW